MSHGPDAKKAQLKPDKVIGRHAAQGNGTRLAETPPYVNTQDKNIEDPKGTTDLRDKTDKSISDKPTTAAAKKGQKSLPAVIGQVGKAAVHLQNMYSMMSMASGILSSMGSSGEQDSPTTSTGKKTIIEDALTGALSILANKWGYDKVIDVFDAALANDAIDLIDIEYQEIVKNALANLYLAAVQNGPSNIPTYEYEICTVIGPEPSPIVTEVPDGYIQEYYSVNEDPYPGYIKWNNLDDTEYVFTKRNIGDKLYLSPEEEVYSLAEQELAEKLDPYIEETNLTASILNDLMVEQNTKVEDNMDEKTLGKGAGGGGLNAQQIAAKLLGFLSIASNLQKSAQLPVSVLNTGSIQKTMQKYEKSTSKHKQIQKFLGKALQLPSAASAVSSALGGAGGIAGAVGAVGSVAGAVGSIGGAVGSVAGAVGSVAGSVSSVAGAVGTVSSAVSNVKPPKILT